MTVDIKPVTKEVRTQTTRDGYAYLTKRILLARAKSAGKAAAKQAMEVMGFVVTVKDGWVVKKYANSNMERIERLES